jgi:hypothetical protein
MTNDYATRQHLKELKEQLEKSFDKELSERLLASFEAFRQENAFQFKLMREELHFELSKFTSVILTTVDRLLGELETRQQDRELSTAHIKKIRTDIKDRNRRVAIFEHSR